MSYQVFALKWRPQNFDEVIGQNHITATLKSALKNNRLAHAYLFTGPRGVGKTSTARILSKALNCKEGPTINPCSKCSSCLEISQGRSLDVIEIDGASNRGIDEIRTLRENVKFAPVNGKFKIYIIDEVHMLTQEAFNALLKTLEEPPGFVKFIFATTQPHKVIPTILSRCQRFDFRRIPVMEIIAQLEKIVAAEKINIEKEVLFTIARSSDGSLRDAESVLDQLVSFSKDRVSINDAISVLGLIEQETLFEITDRIIRKDALAVLELLNNIIDGGKDLDVFLNNLIEHFRNLMIAKIAKADSKLIDLPQDICERLLKQTQAFDLEEIFSTFNILVNTQEISKRLDSLRIPLEINLVKLAHHKKASNLNQPLSKNISQPKGVSSSSHPDANEPLPPASAENKDNTEMTESIPSNPASPISLDNIKESWNNIIERLTSIKMSVATYLNEGIPAKLEHNILNISFPKNLSLHKEALEKKENRTIIEDTLSKLFNTNIRINFILSKEAAQKEEAKDGFLESALRMFKGRLINGE